MLKPPWLRKVVPSARVSRPAPEPVDEPQPELEPEPAAVAEDGSAADTGRDDVTADDGTTTTLARPHDKITTKPVGAWNLTDTMGWTACGGP